MDSRGIFNKVCIVKDDLFMLLWVNVGSLWVQKIYILKRIIVGIIVEDNMKIKKGLMFIIVVVIVSRIQGN